MRYAKNKKGMMMLLEVLVSSVVTTIVVAVMTLTLVQERNFRATLGEQMIATFHAQRIIETMKKIEKQSGIEAVYNNPYFPVNDEVVWSNCDCIDGILLPGEVAKITYPDGPLPPPGTLPPRPLRARVEILWNNNGRTLTEVMEVNL